MKKITKYKCPVCGNYTLNEGGGMYEICEVCNWEDEILRVADMFGSANGMTIEEAKENYKKIGAISKHEKSNIRKPMGIELPGNYEKDNKEAQNDPNYLEYLDCIKNSKERFEKANILLHRSFSDGEKEEAFKTFNYLAFSNTDVGFEAAYNLAICYASGFGCHKNIHIAYFLKYYFLDTYEIK